MSKKYVYFFGNGVTEGRADMKSLLGGKGANLAEMTLLGIPVPPGFTITTEVCVEFYKNNHVYPKELESQVASNLKSIEKSLGKKFGDPQNPLLVSVRSGARASMPGMMDTILNLGLNDSVAEGWKKTGNARFVLDSYRRFIQMYSDVVLNISGDEFESTLESLKRKRGVHLDTELKAEDWQQLIATYKDIVLQKTKKAFPQDPKVQLWGAIGAVFQSWMNKRAIEYRRIHSIPEDWGTAVNVQAMVFGNMGEDCATGVAFTRDPSTGAKIFFGEYLINAHGEDVAAGIRTPQPINIEGKQHGGNDLPSMEETLPKCYQTLVSIYQKLEHHYRDMQDIEFTIENHKVWMLQTRNGKRTTAAAIKIAVDMVKEGLIDKRTAILRIDPNQIDQLLHPTLDPNVEKKVIAKGLPASPGAATGQVVFSAEDAQRLNELGRRVILVRLETSPEDIHGMNVSEGILTARGGMTSHAAVVARGMGKTCVVGCGELDIEEKKQLFQVQGVVVKKGDFITLNGSTGEVMLGEVPTIPPKLTGEFKEFMVWVDEQRKLKVRTNADSPGDARVGREFGAEGIGLCRTEHMFFEGDRIDTVRQMILASDVEERKRALAKILPMQKQDFKGIFRAMKGLPVTIRLLDPPLHEFLPHTDAEILEISKKLDIPPDKLRSKLESLREFNPMLGHRGCRLGITYPEIYEMQVQAIMEAACELVEQESFSIIPEIMIPLVGHVRELQIMHQMVDKVCKEVMDRKKIPLEYLIGTMIELPRAALTADRIAEFAEFFSFGTNDLTQTTFGFSRDDAAKFLPMYIDKKILPIDPFVALDQEGVGKLIAMAVELGRKTRPNIKVGICGEHGGEPSSVIFCHKIGLDYVSCSPYRVPVARLAAAQAVLMEAK